ncbi:MAG: hypothetical protein OSB18_14175, partial [SAR324 cluster bacterium]|nr:hypothetical protein [SAR324 cluster bacterium]
SSIPLLTVSTVIVHTIPHLTSGLGYSLALAGVLFGAMTGFQLLGQFVGGSLGDRFNKRLLCVGCMIAHGVGLYLLTYADSLLMVGGFAMLHGIAWASGDHSWSPFGQITLALNPSAPSRASPQ